VAFLRRPAFASAGFVFVASLVAGCSRQDRPVRGVWSGSVETRGEPATRATLRGPAQCRLLRHRDQDLLVRLAGTTPGPAGVRVSDLASGAPRLVQSEVLAERAGPFEKELRLTRRQLGDTDWVGLGFDRPGLVIDALEVVEKPRKPRVIVFGLDALTFRVLDPLLAAGRLPHFAALMRSGVSGPLLSTPPMLSPVVWTTIATGRTRGDHGINGFVDEEQHLVNSSQVRVKRFWEIVAEHAGASVGILGWFVTWPVEPVAGFMLSDRATSLSPNDRQRPLSFHPPALQAAFDPVVKERQHRYVAELRRFTPFAFDPEWRTHLQPGTPAYEHASALDPIFVRVFLRDSAYVEGGLRLFQALEPDLLAIYLRGSDHAQHGYWFDRAPEESVTAVDPEARRLFGEIIDSYYVYLDEALGRFMDAAPDDTIFMVVSDHGFHSEVRGRGAKRRSRAHHETQGVYVISGPGFGKGLRGRSLSVYDLTPLWLHIFGLPPARDMRGHLPLDLLSPSPAQEPPRIDSYGKRTGHGDTRQSDVDADIVEQLKALGYIQ
jgi:Type I phosphodiesterase / nucleotide pyrophosphatase